MARQSPTYPRPDERRRLAPGPQPLHSGDVPAQSPRHRSRAGKALHRLTLDIDKRLYKQLAQRALDEETSLLELCERWLSERLDAERRA